ncbi:TMF family protein [Tenacibaculum agarivorans]|uniref:TMF family protein n=1 Tax=Tenacibaculum agarivorans TaxID=1908389 RepID=UPI000B0E8AC9|nr:TMF family protein [Tenacibaculum agarivorans]
MKNKFFFSIIAMLLTQLLFSQQDYYNVNSGNGKGLRFWNSNTYKIHMGNASEYKFGPVTDYSIKMNMSNTPGRGWTWGVAGQTPIAGLNTLGDFQIAKNFTAESITIDNTKSDKWIPLAFGREYKPGRKTFEFVVSPDSNRSREYLAMGINDKNQKLRYDFTANDKNTWIDMDDHKGTHFFKVSRDEYEPGKFATYIHMPRSDSRIVIGEYGGYLMDKGHKLVVNNGGAFINGNVGIGTQNPDAKLAVNGRIHTKEVKVDLIGWADYVFKEEYKLPTLEEVADHIKEKGHLINIPSETEVLKNGIQLGEMNAKLLEKIEELTLYTIAQEKKIKEQKNKNEELEARLLRLESVLTKKK